jgi:hypothetical protein
MPWWAALIVGAVWLVVWLMIVFYGLLAAAVVFTVREGHAVWERHRAGAVGQL